MSNPKSFNFHFVPKLRFCYFQSVDERERERDLLKNNTRERKSTMCQNISFYKYLMVVVFCSHLARESRLRLRKICDLSLSFRFLI